MDFRVLVLNAQLNMGLIYMANCDSEVIDRQFALTSGNMQHGCTFRENELNIVSFGRLIWAVDCQRPPIKCNVISLTAGRTIKVKLSRIFGLKAKPSPAVRFELIPFRSDCCCRGIPQRTTDCRGTAAFAPESLRSFNDPGVSCL
jgi:hypothetical protein